MKTESNLSQNPVENPQTLCTVHSILEVLGAFQAPTSRPFWLRPSCLHHPGRGKYVRAPPTKFCDPLPPTPIFSLNWTKKECPFFVINSFSPLWITAKQNISLPALYRKCGRISERYFLAAQCLAVQCPLPHHQKRLGQTVNWPAVNFWWACHQVGHFWITFIICQNCQHIFLAFWLR